MKRSLAWFLGAAVCGLFVEALAWVTRTDFRHWAEMRERPSRAYDFGGWLPPGLTYGRGGVTCCEMPSQTVTATPGDGLWVDMETGSWGGDQGW